MKNQKAFKTIETIRNEYASSGDAVFRMGLSHLLDNGMVNFNTLSEDEFNQELENIQNTTPENSIMTADFQCALMECARKLSQVSLWDLLAYIKDEMYIDGCDNNCDTEIYLSKEMFNEEYFYEWEQMLEILDIDEKNIDDVISISIDGCKVRSISIDVDKVRFSKEGCDEL